jgi:Bacterial Ig domain
VVAAPNTAPVANDASATTNEDKSVTITLSGTDADGDILTFAITDQPDNGVLDPIVTTGPTTATVNYTPNLNYNGPDSFTYKATDGKDGEDTATVTITVSPVNDPPSFTAGLDVTVNEDSGAYSAAWATGISAGPDDEAGQTVTFVVTNNNDALFSTQSTQPAISSSGTLTFTPAPNAFGTATVTVFAQDNGCTANEGDDTSDPQTFTITVNEVND